MSLFLIVALPFLGAALPGLMVGAGRRTCALVTLGVTLTALAGLMAHAPAVLRGEVVTAGVAWLPALGLNATFFLDGLGFFFAALILGMGLLIIVYARYYLAREDPMGQFFCFLLLFQGAMLGIVLADNVLMLLVFWELTSLSSFLLIGYWRHLPEARRGARMALIVTGTGGLAMIAGMLILGQVAGSYELTVILDRREAIQASPLYLPALLLILAGCFAKSAQFPFHFWLPQAMAAPTPVSAYLHSATMVKAGLFLMARLWPVLSGSEAWFYIVATTGLVTMLLGAAVALFRDDLKALLAYSTVSHLGLVTMLLGFATPVAVIAAVFHILNHAIFKAALFMTAGIVDHEAGTRDIRRLGGLGRLMPVTFAVAAVTGLSMAGLPLLNGFLSKEMMLEEAAHVVWWRSAWVVPVLATIGALLSAAYSFRYVWCVFMGPIRDDYPRRPHDPGAGMLLSPALLAVLVVAVGTMPFVAEEVVRVTAAAVTGGALPGFHLRVWHGWTPALWMSLAATLGGVVLLVLHAPLDRMRVALPRPDAVAIFHRVEAAAVAGATWLTSRLHDGSFTRYAAIFTVAVVTLGAHAWWTGAMGAPTRAPVAITFVPAVFWAMLVVATVGIVILHRSRLLALVLMGVVGLVVSTGFLYFSAPDLALTQISVEVVTILLLLLALNFLPDETPVESAPARRARDGTIAAAAGLGAGGLVYALLRRGFSQPSISEYHVANSHTGGGGDNVVNVILVDFRGYDTYGELIVLGIAALVIFAAAEALLDGPARRRLLSRAPGRRRAGNPHPLMMITSTRVLMPLVLLVGVYIFLRGHNYPGGGFIAGLIVAVGVVMQYMASGFAWADARQRYPYHAVIGAGVATAGLTGIGAWFAGKPFLTSAYGYVRIPPFTPFELATAAVFDLGVFLAVVGGVLLSLESFSRLARRPDEPVREHAIEIDPSRGEPG